MRCRTRLFASDDSQLAAIPLKRLAARGRGGGGAVRGGRHRSTRDRRSDVVVAQAAGGDVGDGRQRVHRRSESS